MARWNTLVLPAVACLLSIGLVACEPKGATTDDIAGLWVEQPSDCSTETPAVCAAIRFCPDGTFEARDIQEKFFFDASFTSRVSGSGVWGLDKSSRDPFTPDAVILEFDPIEEATYTGAFVEQLYITTFSGKLALYTWEGDESIRDTFFRKDDADCE